MIKRVGNSIGGSSGASKCLTSQVRNDLLKSLAKAKLTFGRVERMDNIWAISVNMITQGLFKEAENTAMEFIVREYPGFWHVPDDVNKRFWDSITGITDQLIKAGQFSKALNIICLSIDHFMTNGRHELGEVNCYEARKWERTLLLLLSEVGKAFHSHKIGMVDVREMLPKIKSRLVDVTSLQTEGVKSRYKRVLLTFLNAGFIENGLDYAIDKNVLPDDAPNAFYPIDTTIEVLKGRGEPEKLMEDLRSAMKRAGYPEECIRRNLGD